MSIQILEPHHWTGWVTAIINDRWVQAKVYNEPSIFGINNGRVSKLCISKTNKIDTTKSFLAQIDYNYDRGLDFDNLPNSNILVEIVAELEKLPKLTDEEIERGQNEYRNK